MDFRDFLLGAITVTLQVVMFLLFHLVMKPASIASEQGSPVRKKFTIPGKGYFTLTDRLKPTVRDDAAAYQDEVNAARANRTGFDSADIDGGQ